MNLKNLITKFELNSESRFTNTAELQSCLRMAATLISSLISQRDKALLHVQPGEGNYQRLIAQNNDQLLTDVGLAEEDHYWICGDCAKAKGWTPVPYAVTMIHQHCGYCRSTNAKYLSCASTDWIKPGKKTVWD